VTASTASPPAPRLPVWGIVAIAGLFALFYAYVVWTALGFLVQQASGVEGLSGYGWFVLILPVVVPLVVFGLAFAIGWRRGAGQFALVMLTGLGVVAAFWLNIFAYAAASSALYGG
jgi:hypothetical protein